LLLGLILLQKLKYIEVLFMEIDLFLGKAFRNNSCLLLDWLRPSIYLLEGNLHQGGLEFGEQSHLVELLLNLCLSSLALGISQTHSTA